MAQPRQLHCNRGRDSGLPNSALAHGHDHALAVGGNFRNQLAKEAGKSIGCHGRDQRRSRAARSLFLPSSRRASAPIKAVRDRGISNRGQLANSIRHCRHCRIAAALQRLGNQRHLPTRTKAAIHDQPLIAHTKSSPVPDVCAPPPPAQSSQAGSPDKRQFSRCRTARAPCCRRARVALAVHSEGPGTRSHRHWSR